MSLHIKSPGEAPGVYPIAQGGKDLKHLSFTIVELGENFKQHSFDSGDEETCLDFYNGPVRVEAEGPEGRWSVDWVAGSTRCGQPSKRTSIGSSSTSNVTRWSFFTAPWCSFTAFTRRRRTRRLPTSHLLGAG